MEDGKENKTIDATVVMNESKVNGLITKDMTIGYVVNKYPQLIGDMLSYGLHCVGCPATLVETLEEGALVHGLDAEGLVKDLNHAAGLKYDQKVAEKKIKDKPYEI